MSPSGLLAPADRGNKVDVFPMTGYAKPAANTTAGRFVSVEKCESTASSRALPFTRGLRCPNELRSAPIVRERIAVAV